MKKSIYRSPLLCFIIAVFLLCITPGAGVLSLAGTGAAVGLQHGLRYMLGLWAGHSLVSLVVITGLAAIILTEPFVRSVLMLICSGYFLYLAIRIAFAKSKIAFIHMAAPGFVTGLTLNLINPKAYAVHTVLFGGFVLYLDIFLLEVVYKQVVLNFIWICDHVLWLHAGFKINQLNLTTRRQNQINAGMAICIIAVVLISVWSVFLQ